MKPQARKESPLLKSRYLLLSAIVVFSGLVLMLALYVNDLKAEAVIIGYGAFSVLSMLALLLLLRINARISGVAKRLHADLDRNHKLVSRAEWRSAEQYRKVIARMETLEAPAASQMPLGQQRGLRASAPQLEMPPRAMAASRMRREAALETFLVHAIQASNMREGN